MVKPVTKAPAVSMGKSTKLGGGKTVVKAPAPPKNKAAREEPMRSLKEIMPHATIMEHGKYTMVICEGKGALTVEQSKELIGWKVLTDKDGSALRFHLRNSAKERVLLTRNSTNRPYRPGLSKRYMSEKLRRKWFLNGETIIFDENRRCQSGQHRMTGHILADEVRIKEKAKWEKYWKGPVVDECVLFFGISSRSEVVDSIDQGQKRSLGDILYRDDVFTYDSSGADLKAGQLNVIVTDKVKRKLSNILASAIRLCWLRATDKNVADAPHFPASEALEFLEKNPRLTECVLFIYNLDGGAGMKGGKIDGYLSLAYAAGLLYLMMTSGTDPDDWAESGRDPELLSFKMEKKAREFWSKFASGADLKAKDPILHAREMVKKIDAGSGMGRDEIVAVIVKAFNAFADGKEVQAKQLQIRRENRDGVETLAEEPRLGGLDTQGPEKMKEGEYAAAAADAEKDGELDEREGSKSGKDWAEGDEAWVKDADGDHWFGSIDEIVERSKKDGGNAAVLTQVDTGKQWLEPITQLSVKYPGGK